MSWDKALAIARINPSAVDIAAAIPPAATNPEITYGNPAISGVARTTISPLMKNSFKSRIPSELKSWICIHFWAFHAWYQSIFCTSAIDLPIIPVAKFGSIKASLDTVASIGAEVYKSAIKNNDHATDFLAALTLGVVKYLINICGKDAVPTIIHRAKEINFQAAIPPSGTPECDVEIYFSFSTLLPSAKVIAAIASLSLVTNPNLSSRAAIWYIEPLVSR